LVHNPQILVLDEPTAGVDIELRQMLWTNVRRLNKEQGTTIILTTHYLEEAQEMCDEIAIINHGEVVARDTTKNLIGSMDAKTMVIEPDGGAPEVMDLPDGVVLDRKADGSLAFSYSRGKTSANVILDAVKAAGIIIGDVRTVDPDLEDVFVALTSGK
jgi:ABC-2 type transport system ATP-binding protein